MKQLFLPELTYVQGKVERGQGILVEDGVILAVDAKETLVSAHADAQRFDWPKRLAFPGTVNVHNHSFQSLLRGIAADRPFLEWRDQALYKFSPLLSPEDLYWGAVFAFGEMARYGVTTVSDFFYLHNDSLEGDEAIIRAAKDVGVRLVLARTMYDWAGAPEGYRETIPQAVENTRSLAKKYADSPWLRIVPAPHSLHAASLDMIRAGHRLAKDLDCNFHIHVAEEPFEVEEVKRTHKGLHTIELLDSIGVVDERMVIVHGVWLKPEEIQTLGAHGGKLAYCPSSNMFLADGVTDLVAMHKAGVVVGLGSDGACSNNRISIFEEMRMASLLQKVHTCNAMSVNYNQAVAMGTENGGTILQMPVGTIAPGYNADFVSIDLADLSMQPLSGSLEQLLPNLVYSMQPNAIDSVVVGGRLVSKRGELQTVPNQTITQNVQRILERLTSI